MSIHQEYTFVASEPRDFYEDEAPDHLQDDPLVSYFRSRYKEREDLLVRLKGKKHEFERIKQELARIEELRSEFDSSHTFFMERLRTSREAWKRYAKGNCAEETRKVEKMIADVVEKDDKTAREQLSRKQFELNILKRVPNIEMENLSPESGRLETEDSSIETESVLVDPDHGFMTNMITLTKDSHGSSYVHFKMEKYPVNEALDGSPSNPLKQRCKHCEPDTLRYFHFPANNMSWIEVCPSHSLCNCFSYLLIHRGRLPATMAKNSESTITESQTITARNHPISSAESSGPVDSTEPKMTLFMPDICGLSVHIFFQVIHFYL